MFNSSICNGDSKMRCVRSTVAIFITFCIVALPDADSATRASLTTMSSFWKHG